EFAVVGPRLEIVEALVALVLRSLPDVGCLHCCLPPSCAEFRPSAVYSGGTNRPRKSTSRIPRRPRSVATRFSKLAQFRAPGGDHSTPASATRRAQAMYSTRFGPARYSAQ